MVSSSAKCRSLRSREGPDRRDILFVDASMDGSVHAGFLAFDFVLGGDGLGVGGEEEDEGRESSDSDSDSDSDSSETDSETEAEGSGGCASPSSMKNN